MENKEKGNIKIDDNFYRIIDGDNNTKFIVKEDLNHDMFFTSVIVDDIIFEEEQKVFLMIKDIPVSDINVKIYFYLDLDFKPIGLVYDDITQGYDKIDYENMGMNFNNYFPTYCSFKKVLLEDFLENKRNFYLEQNKKLLNVRNKGEN